MSPCWYLICCLLLTSLVIFVHRWMTVVPISWWVISGFSFFNLKESNIRQSFCYHSHFWFSGAVNPDPVGSSSFYNFLANFYSKVVNYLLIIFHNLQKRISSHKFFWIKKILCCGSGFGIRCLFDPGSGTEKSLSGIWGIHPGPATLLIIIMKIDRIRSRIRKDHTRPKNSGFERIRIHTALHAEFLFS
jgi:hypothetical protein